MYEAPAAHAVFDPLFTEMFRYDECQHDPQRRFRATILDRAGLRAAAMQVGRVRRAA